MHSSLQYSEHLDGHYFELFVGSLLISIHLALFLVFVLFIWNIFLCSLILFGFLCLFLYIGRSAVSVGCLKVYWWAGLAHCWLSAVTSLGCCECSGFQGSLLVQLP